MQNFVAREMGLVLRTADGWRRLLLEKRGFGDIAVRENIAADVLSLLRCGH